MSSPAIPPYSDLLGLPYEKGARGPHKYDCYGVVRVMFNRMGFEVPDFDTPGTVESMEAILRDKSRAWQRVPFGTPGSAVTMRIRGIGSHVGFMLTEDRFIHATENTGVTTDRISLPPFSNNKIAAYIYE